MYTDLKKFKGEEITDFFYFWVKYPISMLFIVELLWLRLTSNILTAQKILQAEMYARNMQSNSMSMLFFTNTKCKKFA